MKKTMILAAALATAVSATSASAATANFDFAAIADAFWAEKGFEGDFDQVNASGAGAAFVTSAVSLLNAIGTYTGGDAYAFFDHTDGSGPAGLGVCHSGYSVSGKSKCSTGVGPDTDDDNITKGEALELVFSKAVTLTDLLIRNVNHKLANGEMVINGNVYNIINGVVQTDLAALGTKKTFSFGYADTDTTPTEIYLSTMTVAPVPVPAAGLLLLTALGGLAAARRRKSA